MLKILLDLWNRGLGRKRQTPEEDSTEIDDGVKSKRRKLDDDDKKDEKQGQWAEVISSSPRALIFHNFLSEEECEHLINLVKPHLRRSLFVDARTGQSYVSSARTSNGAFLRRGGDEVIGAIEKRIADYTKIPIENGEGMQVLHYAVGQKVDSHFDYDPTCELFTRNGGPRMATFLMYLSDVEEGGETVFPHAKTNVGSVCYHGALSVQPKMGDALLFWNTCPNGTRDPSSLHASKHVIKGDKWSCTKWMRVTEFKC